MDEPARAAAYGQLHTIERISRPNFDTLIYEVTIDDPGAYTDVWSGGFYLNWRKGNEPFDYLCQENNLDPSTWSDRGIERF